jgi:hypothetical protein
MNTASKFSARIFPDGHADGHRTIVIRSIAAMNKVLRKDICSLGRPDFCIIDDQTPQSDPLKSILYSCVYWIDHLCEMASDHDRIGLCDNGSIDAFWKNHFLHWLEALSLTRSISESVAAISKLASLLEVIQSLKHIYTNR